MARTPEVTHKIMSAIRGHDTAPELILRKAVWKTGLRYRVNDRRVYGRPDITFSRAKLAVFCDGDYWHGHNWALRGYKDLNDELSHYKPFWAEKIRRNVERDRDVDKKLTSEGWYVLRFWENDIRNDAQNCAQKILTVHHKLIKQANDKDF